MHIQIMNEMKSTSMEVSYSAIGNSKARLFLYSNDGVKQIANGKSKERVAESNDMYLSDNKQTSNQSNLSEKISLIFHNG